MKGYEMKNGFLEKDIEYLNDKIHEIEVSKEVYK
jgi:hypothetical protein